jgi:phosphoribosylamine--glycine ligase
MAYAKTTDLPLPSAEKKAVLVVGSGGREHAIACKLRESTSIGHIFCAPGNGGTALECDMTNVPVKDSDIEGLVRLATEKKSGSHFRRA